MRIFREALLPDTCYVTEAACWLALGRVPDFLTNDEGFDSRNDEEAAFTGERVDSFRTDFSEMEFRMIGVDVDIDRYEEVVARAGQLSGAEYLVKDSARWGSLSEPLDETATQEDIDSRNTLLFIIDDSRQTVARDIEWARDVEAEFTSTVDLAQAEVVAALVSGRLKAFGWVKHEEPGSDGELGHFVDIPAKAWSLRYFDWNESLLTSRSCEYKNVQVFTEAVLDVFPRPSCAPLTAQVSVFAETLIWDEKETNDHVRMAKKSRGRRPIAGLPIREVVQNYFAARARNPLENREALYLDVIAFVLKAFKKDIARTTAQEYLAPCSPKP
jgi:hypothetical protein